MDLVQEGNLGLLKAVYRFEPERGYRLISYAVWWIRAHIQEYILKNWSLVKIGTTQLQRRLFNNLQSSQKRLQRLTASDSETERTEMLAREVGGTVDDVRQMQQRLTNRDASLDAPAGPGEDESYTLKDRIEAGDRSSNAEDLYAEVREESLIKMQLREAVATLDHREREIVTQRHLTEEPRTLKELGAVFGVSKERVRQLEERALKRLRAVMVQAEAAV